MIDEAVAQVVPQDNSMASQLDNLAVRQEDQLIVEARDQEMVGRLSFVSIGPQPQDG